MIDNRRPKITTTDGFVIRRRSGHDGLSLPRPKLDTIDKALPPKFLVDSPSKKQDADIPGFTRRNVTDLGKDDLGGFGDATQSKGPDLLAEDVPPAHQKPDRSKPQKVKKPRIHHPGRTKKVIISCIVGILLLGLGLGGYFAWKFFATGGKIFNGNIVNAVFAPPKELKMDENGRSNVLLFGTSEDDPDHAGADLTDSMMIVSVDQKKNNAFLVSIPRDLYVDYGQACPSGYKGKINAYYSCIKEDQGEDAAQQALRTKVGEVFGLDMQYSAHINYTALRQAVDAVGGVTVTINSSDPRGIMDRNFDWDCPKGPYTCYNVKYANGPVNLDGKHALYLARARGASGNTYGLPQANFDREKYQREILIALKDKAVSAGTLANPVAVNNLLDAVGNNVRTNFSAEEIKTLVKLGQDVKSENIASLVLNDPNKPLVTTGNIGGQSIVKPALGLSDFSAIQAAIRAYATGDTAALENATVDVLNASGTSGLATSKAEELTAKGITVGVVANAASALNTGPMQLYDLSGKTKPGTRKKLETLLNVTASDTPPASLKSDADFVVIIGTQPTQ